MNKTAGCLRESHSFQASFPFSFLLPTPYQIETQLPWVVAVGSGTEDVSFWYNDLVLIAYLLRTGNTHAGNALSTTNYRIMARNNQLDVVMGSSDQTAGPILSTDPGQFYPPFDIQFVDPCTGIPWDMWMRSCVYPINSRRLHHLRSK